MNINFNNKLDQYTILELKEKCDKLNINTKGLKLKQQFIEAISNKKNEKKKENCLNNLNKIDKSILKKLPSCPKICFTPRFSNQTNDNSKIWGNSIKQVFGNDPITPIPNNHIIFKKKSPPIDKKIIPSISIQNINIIPTINKKKIKKKINFKLFYYYLIFIVIFSIIISLILIS